MRCHRSLPWPFALEMVCCSRCVHDVNCLLYLLCVYLLCVYLLCVVLCVPVLCYPEIICFASDNPIIVDRCPLNFTSSMSLPRVVAPLKYTSSTHAPSHLTTTTGGQGGVP